MLQATVGERLQSENRGSSIPYNILAQKYIVPKNKMYEEGTGKKYTDGRW